MTDNHFTLEQKAKAFDELWEGCGHAPGKLYDYVRRLAPLRSIQSTDISSPAIPRYEFRIVHEGWEMYFRDVLANLATRK
jgi:hypothetical protein